MLMRALPAEMKKKQKNELDNFWTIFLLVIFFYRAHMAKATPPHGLTDEQMAEFKGTKRKALRCVSSDLN